MATRLYPTGVLIEEDHLQHEKAVQRTLSLIGDTSVPAIYEAAFSHDDVLVRTDILERRQNGKWNLIEVKSSTSVKDVHLLDVAIQYHVLKGSGLTIDRCGILHLNNQYVYNGMDLRLESLFSFSELTKKVATQQEKISWMITEFRKMLSCAVPPAVDPSRSCNNPYDCEFWAHCIREKPEFWVMQLSGITQRTVDELTGLNIEDIRDIPGSFPLTRLQERIRTCAANREGFVSSQLTVELRNVESPIHFLDFETVSPAIPRYASTRPYQAIPFQWSDHIVDEDGTIRHREYLCREDKDPRDEFSRTLLEALGYQGTIFVYTNYEKQIVSQLAEFLPEYRDRLRSILSRFRDLHALIRKHVYYPEFYGSFSLKSVLPALVPSMRYDDLFIQGGRHASVEYLRMIHPDTSQEEREEIRRALLSYCGYDTLGMAKIREELLERNS